MTSFDPVVAAAMREANRSVKTGPSIAVVNTKHKHNIEHAIVQQPLTGCVERLMCDQRSCKRSGDLRECERPDRQLLTQIVSICPSDKPSGDPFTGEQGANDA